MLVGGADAAAGNWQGDLRRNGLEGRDGCRQRGGRKDPVDEHDPTSEVQLLSGERLPNAACNALRETVSLYSRVPSAAARG